MAHERTVKKRIRNRGRGERAPIRISPLEGEKRYGTRLCKFRPMEGTTPESVKEFLAYCRSRYGRFEEKVLENGMTIYKMEVNTDRNTTNSLKTQAHTYGMHINWSWGSDI